MHTNILTYSINILSGTLFIHEDSVSRIPDIPQIGHTA